MKPPLRHAQIAPVAALGGLVVLSTVAFARAGVALCDRRIALAPASEAPPAAMPGMAMHGMAMHGSAMGGALHTHAGVCPIVLFLTIAAAALTAYALWALGAREARREALATLAHCTVSSLTTAIAVAAGAILGFAALAEPDTVSGPAALFECAVVVAGALAGSIGIAGMVAALVRAGRTLAGALAVLAERGAAPPAPFARRRPAASAAPARRLLALRRGLRAPPLTA